MSENKTIKNFTAADIEKYWNKKLIPAEMHELEKAAMNDPFLAEALEGYQYSTNPEEEAGILKEKIEKKLNDAVPVIPIYRRKYKWLRVAAAVIVLVGAGLLVQQLAFKTNKEGPVVNVNKPIEKSNNETVSNEVVSQTASDTIKNQTPTTETATVKTDKFNTNVADLNTSYAFTPVDSSKFYNVEANTIKERKYDTLTASVLGNTIPEKKEIPGEKTKAADDNIAAAAKMNNRADGETAAKAKWSSNNAKQVGLLNNSFNYRVVDAQNNPVPFANILNTRDNVGTYTDVRGYFNLVSSDSVLDVQVRSLGYNSENYKLIPSRQANDLVLKEDATARNFMEDNRGRVMSPVSRKDSADVVEPEVGWGNYNTYVENNIKIPENVRAKNALDQVELSFDVDKSGTPINIKITKSSQCKECDEEAKRLLKEGPKWKRKGKKSKTTISISVDQK